MRYPAGTWPWRLFPPSRGPGVRVAIPTLVSGNPDMVTAGRRRPLLDLNTGRRAFNHNIGRDIGEGHRARQNQPEQSFKNHNTLLFLGQNREMTLASAVLSRRRK